MALSKIHVRTSCSGHVHTSVHFRVSYAQMVRGAYFATKEVFLHHAGHVLREVPDTGRYVGSSGWGLGVELTSALRRNSTVSIPRQRRGHRSATEEEEEKKKKKTKKKVQLMCNIKFVCCYHKLTASPADITVKPNHIGRSVSRGQKFNNLPSYSEGPGLKSWPEYWHVFWYFVTYLSTYTKME